MVEHTCSSRSNNTTNWCWRHLLAPTPPRMRQGRRQGAGGGDGQLSDWTCRRNVRSSRWQDGTEPPVTTGLGTKLSFLLHYYISWHVLRVYVLPAAVCSLKDWPEYEPGPERAVRYECCERGVVEERVEPMRRVMGRLCSQCSLSTNEHWRPTAPAHWLERAGPEIKSCQNISLRVWLFNVKLMWMWSADCCLINLIVVTPQVSSCPLLMAGYSLQQGDWAQPVIIISTSVSLSPLLTMPLHTFLFEIHQLISPALADLENH